MGIYENKTAFLIYLFFVLSLCNCSDSNIKKNELLRKIRFKVENTERQYISITNDGADTAKFDLRLNDNLIYTSFDQILHDVKSFKKENQIPLQKKVWSYLTFFTVHNYPLTEHFWYHNPILFLNSVGFGFCDDVSMVSHYLWSELGMQARVWGYQGHVVSEVLANNRWELYDVDKRIYFFNDKNEIAGIDEIIENPEIILSPNKPIVNDKNIASHVYSEVYYNFLANPKAYSIKPPEDIIKNFDFQFVLAPGMSMSLPYKFVKPLYTNIISSNNDRKEIENYLNLRISLLPGMKYTFNYPLVLHDITGKGDFILRNSQVAIGSTQLTNYINSWQAFIYPFSIYAKEKVDVYFLLNPLRFSLKENNELILSGDNLDSLNIRLHKTK
jgi:hypothetical protein